MPLYTWHQHSNCRGPRRREKQRVWEKSWNFPSMENEIVNQVQGTQRFPYRINPKRNKPRHIPIKLLLLLLLLLLLSHFTCVRLFATPQMAGHQAPPSLGISRQEYWSGLPFPSLMHACMLSRFSCVWLCVTLWTATHQAQLSAGFFRQ